MARPTAIPDRNERHDGGLGFLFAAALACPHGLMIEQRGRVVYANPAYAQLYGFAVGERILGTPVRELRLRPPHGNSEEREYDQLNFDFRDGGRRLRLHVARDVTERRALEGRLRESEKLEAVGRLVGGV